MDRLGESAKSATAAGQDSGAVQRHRIFQDVADLTRRTRTTGKGPKARSRQLQHKTNPLSHLTRCYKLPGQHLLMCCPEGPTALVQASKAVQLHSHCYDAVDWSPLYWVVPINRIKQSGLAALHASQCASWLSAHLRKGGRQCDAHSCCTAVWKPQGYLKQ